MGDTSCARSQGHHFWKRTSNSLIRSDFYFTSSTGLQAAGIVSKVFEHPFDLTKVRLQVQVLDATARFRGPLDCLARTFTDEGVRGLYRVRPVSLYPL